MATKKPVVFSGIQSSGNLHIGNYLGAIRHWVASQSEKSNFFCVVDLHAITIPQDPQVLRGKIKEVAALYLACGIDPEASTIFVQSQNPDHTCLAWILDCVASVGQLKRMTQFKEKSVQQKEGVSMGLLNYPVLMAADILLYHTNEVPVGEDQQQHVELARELARRFNSRFGDVFTVPEAKIATGGVRVKSLQDPTSKMSKSDSNSRGAVYLLDAPEVVRTKIKAAVTDSGSEIHRGSDKPAVNNLLDIYSLLAEVPITELEERYVGKSYREFKEDLAEVVVEFLEPLQERYREIVDDPTYLNDILETGLGRAKAVSGPTLRKVEEVVGLGL